MAKYTVLVNVLKTYEIEVEANSEEDAEAEGNAVQSTAIENDGDLIDVETNVISTELIEEDDEDEDD